MELIPEGATVYKTHYKEILGCLHDSIGRRKRSELWRWKHWLLLHDNAFAHHSVLVHEELARQPVTVLLHPSYLPDLAPCDFLSLSPHESTPTWAKISFGWRGHDCRNKSRMGTSCQHDSAVLSAAIPTLADMHSGQRQLFWGRMWFCLNVCHITRLLVRHPLACGCLFSRHQSQNLMTAVVKVVIWEGGKRVYVSSVLVTTPC